MTTIMALLISAGISKSTMSVSGVAAFLLAIFTPIAVFYHILVIFLALNFISGLWDDLKHGKKFEYSKFMQFVTRIVLYMLAVTATWIFEKYIIYEFLPTDATSKYLTTVASGMFALYELQSFLCNAASISDNPIFIKISTKIKNFFNEKVKDGKTRTRTSTTTRKITQTDTDSNPPTDGQ